MITAEQARQLNSDSFVFISSMSERDVLDKAIRAATEHGKCFIEACFMSETLPLVGELRILGFTVDVHDGDDEYSDVDICWDEEQRNAERRALVQLLRLANQ